MQLKYLAIIGAVITGLVTISIIYANTECTPPDCYEITVDGQKYRLKGDAAIAYNDLISREIDYYALKLYYPYANEIAIAIEGDKKLIDDFIDTYQVNLIKEKIVDSHLLAFGIIKKENLNIFFNRTSDQSFRESRLSIALLKGYMDNGVMKDQFNKFLDNIPEEEEAKIANILEMIERNRIKEIIAEKNGVELLSNDKD